MNSLYTTFFLSAFISLNAMAQDLSLLAGQWSIPCYAEIANPEDIICSEGMQTDKATIYFDVETGKGQLHQREDAKDAFSLIEIKKEHGKLVFVKRSTTGKTLHGEITQLDAKELHVQYREGAFIHYYFRKRNRANVVAAAPSQRLADAIRLLNRRWSTSCSAPIGKKEEMECVEAAGGANGKPHNLFEINTSTGFGERTRMTMDVEKMMVRLYEEEGKLLLSTIYRGGVERLGEVIRLDASKLEVQYEELGEIWYFNGN